VLLVAGVVVLLPAFNTINASHLDNVAPPDNLPPPPTLPSHLPNVAPKDGKSNATRPLPADCPPPVEKVVYSRQFANQTDSDTRTIEVPPAAAAIGGRVQFQGFVGQFSGTLRDPSGKTVWSPAFDTVSTSGLGGPYSGTDDYQPSDPPSPGAWTISWQSQTFVGGGAVSIALALPCGGRAIG
jgi:hypothetical protein